MEGEKSSVEEELNNNLEILKSELTQVKGNLEALHKEKDEATQRCKEMEEYIAKMGVEFKETMHMVSNSIDWGKGKRSTFSLTPTTRSFLDVPGTITEAQKYSQSLVKDIVIRECQDKIKQLEKENNFHKEAIAMVVSDCEFANLYVVFCPVYMDSHVSILNLLMTLLLHDWIFHNYPLKINDLS